MLFFVDRIPRLQNKQVAHTIVDIIRSFHVRKDNVKYSATLFALIIDILCSEGILVMDAVEKVSVCYETLQRLPTKMYMETETIEVAALLETIVRDVVLGDMFHENADLQHVLGPGNKSVTFSRHIDMGEFSRQMGRLEHILMARKIVDVDCMHAIVKKTTQTVFVQLQRMRNNTGNNKDIHRIIGGTLAEVVRDKIVESLALQICVVDKNNPTSNEHCTLWMGVLDIYSSQHTLEKPTDPPKTHTNLVRKMVRTREHMQQYVKTHGFLAAKDMVKQILTVVLKILPVTADFIKIKEDNTCMPAVKMVLSRANLVDMHTKIHEQAHIHRGVHLLEHTDIARPTTPLVKEVGMVIPQSLFEAVSNMPTLLQTHLDAQHGRYTINTWLRQHIVVSFLHILWSVYST